MAENKANMRVIKSRIQLLLRYPFYGTLALSLKVIEDYQCPTAGVDGKNFYYNPDFIDRLSDGELNWLMAHEVLHCALGHIWRGGSRNKDQFNQAADYAIHCILKESECEDFKMPAGGLYDAEFNGASTEQIYEKLPAKQKQQSQYGEGGGQGQGQQTLDDHGKWNSPETQQNKQMKEKEWQNKMISAAQVAENKKQGSVPAGIARLVGKIVKPQKNWKQLLAEFIQFEVFDFGFNPPDKRYYGYSDVLMPDFNEQTEKIQDICFIIDTSGSISNSELSTFFNELVGMMQQFHNSVQGHILFTDAEVAAVYDFDDVDDILKVKPAGGGGTDMEAAIDYCIKKKDDNEWDVCGCCILTDGWTDYTKKEEDIPFKVLWVVTDESQQPTYGQVARLKI